MANEEDAARKLFAGPCAFVAGAATAQSMPPSRLPEVAFAGRSNVGKSSLINALVGNAKLARVSATPGRTRQINFFRLSDRLMLADLPGYGFARASGAEKARWAGLITDYLQTRAPLKRVMLLVDARRGVMAADREAMALLDRTAISYQAVLTKIDEVKAREALMAGVAEQLRAHAAAHPDVIATSAKTGEGLPSLRVALSRLASR